MKTLLSEIRIPGLSFFKKGKVRDIYEFEDKLLIIASDRISAFDYVLPSLIPDKGKVLTQLSKFWFDFTSLVCQNHVITAVLKDLPPSLQEYKDLLEKRFMLVKKTEVVPVECIVRGYLAGSGWKEYQETGRISGVKLPPDLKEADRFEEPIFTPTTKAEEGHDQSLSFKEMQKIVGSSLAERIRKISIELYRKASLYAISKEIIISDTKFEFGVLEGELILVDEIFTPDSSRFWPAAEYSPGRSQICLDKQFVRDYLEQTDWDKSSPPPVLPESIVQKTSEMYLKIYQILTENQEL